MLFFFSRLWCFESCMDQDCSGLLLVLTLTISLVSWYVVCIVDSGFHLDIDSKDGKVVDLRNQR